MERLRLILQQVSAQLGLLSFSQRMTVALAAALVVVSFLWLTMWSGAPELVPLLPEKMSLDELAAAQEVLKDEPLEVRGARLFIRSGDRHRLIMRLHEADALPEGSLYDLAAAVLDKDPFLSPEQRKFKETVAKGNELAQMISSSPLVRQARVIINERSRRRLGGQSEQPSASVAVHMNGENSITRVMAEGWAKLVAGAVAGLQPHNVTITDGRTGRAHPVTPPDQADAADYLERVKQYEEHLWAKILDSLNIPGLRGGVTVELDTERRLSTKYRHDKAQPKSEEKTSSEDSDAATASETGTQANVGAAVSKPGAGATSASEQSREEFYPPNLAEQEQVETLRFTPKSVTATIGIPRSYVVGVYRARNPAAEDPTDQDLQAERDAQVSRVRNAVAMLIQPWMTKEVHVDVYPDMEWRVDGQAQWAGAPGIAAGTDDGLKTTALELLQGYGTQVALGMTALLSFLMVARIARRSAALMPSVPAAEADFDLAAQGDSDRILTVGSHTVGQAESSEGFLTAQELDDEAMYEQQLVQEVGRLVEKNPLAAAEMIRRWVEEHD
jgi:flagellar biosynthesis/type III secretory pathway M-ring protein FliF/YscJ